MKKKFLIWNVLCVLIFSVMACNFQTLMAGTPPAVTSAVATQPETAPIVDSPTIVTEPVVLTSTAEALAVSQTQAAIPTETPTQTNTPTITLSPTITPLTYTPTPPPTVTSTWTPTPVTPTSTPRSGTRRFATSVGATYLEDAPTIDGDWTEWSTDTYSAHAVVYGGDQWVGSNDLECNFRIGWDYQYLYIAAEVIDDSYAQNATGADIYKGDSLELLVDSNVEGDYSSSAMSGDDYQLAISPGLANTSGSTSAYLYYPSGSRGGRGFSIESTGGSSVYYVEAAIPWSVFGIDPDEGDHYGFSFSVSDNDNPSDNVQESMVSNVGGRKLLNPTTWGDLTLDD